MIQPTDEEGTHAVVLSPAPPCNISATGPPTQRLAKREGGSRVRSHYTNVKGGEKVSQKQTVTKENRKPDCGPSALVISQQQTNKNVVSSWCRDEVPGKDHLGCLLLRGIYI